MNNPIKRKVAPGVEETKVAKTVTKKKTVAKPAPKPVFKRATKPITLKPRISEKTYAGAESHNVYVFEVPRDVNKHDVGYAITAQYEVTVNSVRLANASGKPKRSYRRGGRYFSKSQRSDIRKAYVTLAEGDKLPIFSAIEESMVADKETK